MADGSPAPDLFAALAWSDRVAPPSTSPVDRADVASPPTSPLIADVARPVPAAVSPPVPGGVADFGALADALEPAADVSPVLDEFEGLLDVFDESPAGPAPGVAAPRLSSPLAPPRAPSATPRLAPPVASAVAMPATALPPVTTPRRPTPVVASLPMPHAQPPRVAAFPAPGDPAVSAQLAQVGLDVSSPALSRVAAPIEDEPAPRRGMPVVWIAATLMLGGALAYVLATQTDLLAGDVIERRNAEVQLEAEREAELAQAKLDATRVEYGTIEIDSVPKGARVFEVRDGPQARFEHLPVEHEYMVAVTAPGHVPRVRIVKGTELAAPVILDLDPVAEGAAVPPMAEERPPKLAARPGAGEATLDLRSNTPGARLGLLVGFTPGVKIIDVDVEQPHRYDVVLPGHDVAEIVVKGRHFEEQGGALVVQQSVTLVPSTPVVADDAVAEAADAEGADADDGDADDGEPDVVVVDEAPPVAAPAKPPAPKTKKKHRKKKRR